MKSLTLSLWVSIALMILVCTWMPLLNAAPVTRADVDDINAKLGEMSQKMKDKFEDAAEKSEEWFRGLKDEVTGEWS